MRSRVFRTFVTLATFAVVWLAFGRTAEASAAYVAPLCDPRGASAIAPPPQMQSLEMSLDVVVVDDDCSDLLDAHQVTPGRAPRGAEGASASQPQFQTPSAVVTPTAPNDRLPAPAASIRFARPGFRVSLDRPPRA